MVVGQKRHNDGTSGSGRAVPACRAFRQARRGVRPRAIVEIDYPPTEYEPSTPAASASLVRLSTPVLRKMARRWFSTVHADAAAARDVFVGRTFGDVGGDLTLAAGQLGEGRHGCGVAAAQPLELLRQPRPAQRRGQWGKQSSDPGDVRVAETTFAGRSMESEHEAFGVGVGEPHDQDVMDTQWARNVS
jgi:hypothetical protein